MTTHPASTRTATTTRRRRIRAALLVVVAALVLSAQGVNPISEVLGRQLTPTEPIAASATGKGSGGGNNGNGGGNSGSNNGNGNGNAPFTIAGQTSGLAPGVAQPLHLTITNTQNFDIIVKTVTVTVQSSNKAGCSAANATATGLNGSLVVPKNGTAPLTLSVRMVANPADACQGAEFALAYSGTGVKK